MDDSRQFRIALLGKDIWIEFAGKALSRLGHEVRSFDLSASTTPEELENSLRGYQPNFAMGRNYYPSTSTYRDYYVISFSTKRNGIC